MSKTLKWLFLSLWALSLFVFIIGQFLAPPDYGSVPNNLWGPLFGISVIVGLTSFFLAVLFFFLDKSKHQNDTKPNDIKPKYDLSFKRIASRLILTFFVGLIFGAAMFPFMTVADGLLFQQRAVIGDQNIIRMIFLWGLFTLIITLITFWKKHFRMVSVLLIICWFVGLSLYLLMGMYDANTYSCKRKTPYLMPNEFIRSLDLIAQRMNVDKKQGQGTIWQIIYNFRNCLDIQYLETNDKSYEAYFEYPTEKNLANLQDLKIMVNPSYQNFDDLTLATLLAHELVHSGQYINEVAYKNTLDCYDQEAKSYLAQHAFLLSLNEEEQRSIYTRLQDNIDKNPQFQLVLVTSQLGNESAQACNELQKKNNLTNDQVNKCSWDGLENKIKQIIQEDPIYQEQCEL